MKKANPQSVAIQKLKERLSKERKARRDAETIAHEGLREIYNRHQQILLMQRIAVVANEAQNESHALQAAVDLICAHNEWAAGHAMLFDEASRNFVPTSIWNLPAVGNKQNLKKQMQTLLHSARSQFLPALLATGAAQIVKNT